MNKNVIFSLIASLLLWQPAFASPTNFSSDSFGIESVIIGGTGVLRSAESVAAPIITEGPTVTNKETELGSKETSSVVTWKTDKLSNSSVMYRTKNGTYEENNIQTNSALVGGDEEHVVTLYSLKKNVTYFYKVTSTDEYGNVAQSNERQFQSESGDMDAPVITNGPHITINSASSIIVHWETNENASSEVEYGVKNLDNTTGRAKDQTTVHNVTIDNLVPSRTYSLRVRSGDISGNITTSATQDVTTLNAPAITEVKITDITLSTAIVQWKTSAPTSSTLQMGTAPGKYDRTIPDNTYSQNHLMKIDQLVSGTTYYLRIFGKDQSDAILSSDEYVFQTVVVPIISGLKVTDITSYSARVTWYSSSAIDEIISYQILRSDDSRSNGKKFSAGNDKMVTEHSYVLEDLESGSTYSLSTVGKDIFGNQAISGVVLFTVLPDSEAPTIGKVRIDTSVDLGSKQSVQVLVSFELSEPGKAIIEYGGGANGPYTGNITTDEEISRAKFLVIPGLSPGESYHFRIKATDRVGNTATSADYLVLAPSQPVSLYDLIFGQIRQNFGWLQRIGN